MVGIDNGMDVNFLPYRLSDGTMTDMYDLGELDRINAYIKAIRNNEPFLGCVKFLSLDCRVCKLFVTKVRERV